MTSYTDLDTLAAKATNHPNGAVGALVRSHLPTVWSYPGCPIDGGNIRVPRENASDARVQAALLSGEWVPIAIGHDGKPSQIGPAGCTLAIRPPLQPAEIGSARATGPSRFRFSIGDADSLSPFTGEWRVAWQRERLASLDGSNLGITDLILEIVSLDGSAAPAVGDHVKAMWTGARYVVVATNLTAGLGPIQLRKA